MSEVKRPTFPIGINVFVVRDGKPLLGRRKNCYCAGTWGLPGGHFEIGEDMKTAAARELYRRNRIKREIL